MHQNNISTIMVQTTVLVRKRAPKEVFWSQQVGESGKWKAPSRKKRKEEERRAIGACLQAIVGVSPAGRLQINPDTQVGAWEPDNHRLQATSYKTSALGACS